MTTVSDVRFAISSKFREIESLVDMLQNELAAKDKELESFKKKDKEHKEKKD